MSKHIKIFVSGLVLFLILIVCFAYFSYFSDLVIVEFDDVKVYLEVADTDDERREGLMYRESMPNKHGMIFVYDLPQNLNFWMKNTLIPLDMIWVDSFNFVQHIEHALPCESDTCDIYSWDGKAQYLIELNGGFTEKYDINVGDEIIINF